MAELMTGPRCAQGSGMANQQLFGLPLKSILKKPRADWSLPGTRKTVDPCHRCKGRVYPVDKINIEFKIAYHKECFTCLTCGRKLTLRDFHLSAGKEREIFCLRHVPTGMTNCRFSPSSRRLQRSVSCPGPDRPEDAQRTEKKKYRTSFNDEVRYSYIDQEWEYDPETLDERLSAANAKEAGLEDIAIDEASKRNSLGRKRKSWLKDNENDVTENPVKEVNETDLDNDLEPVEPTTDLDPEEGATNGDEKQQGDEPGGTDEEDVVEQDDVLYETFLGAYGNKLQGLEETFRKEKDYLLNELTGGISANRGRTVPCVGERPTAGMPAEAGPGAYQNSDLPEPTHAKRPKHEGPGISPDAILAAMIMEKLSGQKPIRTHVGRAKDDDLSFTGSKEEIPTLPYRTLKGHQALPPGMGPPHYSPRESGRGRGDPRHGYPYRPGDRPLPQPRPRPDDAERPRPAPKRNAGPIIHGARPHGAPAPPRTPEPELIDDPVLGAVSAALEQKEAYERERQEGRDPMVFVETCLGVDGDFYNSPRKERKFGIKRDMSVDALTDDRPKRELSMDTRAKSLERGLEEARREETSLDQPMDTGVSTTLDRGRDRERQMRAKKPLVNGSDGSLNGSRERVKPAVKPKPKIPEKLRQEFRASSAERKTGPTVEAKVSTSVEIGTVERTIVSKQQQQNESAVIEVVELSDTSGKSSEGTPNTSVFDVSKHGQSSNSSSKDNSKPGSGGHKPNSATDDLLYNAMFQQSIDAAIARQVAARSKPRDRTASLEHERDRAASRDRKERDRAAFFKDKDRDTAASLERDRAASVETRERDRTASTERTSPRDQSASLDRSVNRSKDTVEIHTTSKSLPRSKDQKSREKPKGAQESYSSSQSSFSSDAKDSPRQVDTMIRVTTQKTAGPILSGSTPTGQKQTSGPVLAGSTPQSTSKGPVIAGHQPDTSREVDQEIGTVERSVDGTKGGIEVPTPFVVARNTDGYASVEGKPQRRYKKKSETNVVYTEVEVSDSFRTPNNEMKFDADTSKPRSASNDRRLEMELTPKSGSKDKRKKGNESRSRKDKRNASFDSPQYSLETNDTTYVQDSMAEAAVRGAVRDRVHDIFGEESTLSPVTPAGQVMDDRSSTPMNAGRKDRKGSGGFFSFGSKRKPKKSRDQMASGESSLDTTLNTTMDSNFDKKSLASMGSQEVLNETAKRKENKHRDRDRQRSKDRTVKTKDKKLRGKEALREVTNQDVDSIQDMYIEGDDDLLQKEDLENLGRVPIEMTSTPDNQRRVKKKVREKRTEVEVVDMQESSFREVPKGERTRPSQDDVESDYYTTQDVMSAMIVGAMEGKRRTPRKKTRQRNEGDRSLERSVDLDEERVEITEVSVEERKEGRGRTERRYKKKTQEKPSPATAAVMSELLLRVGATPGRQESESVEDGEVRYRKKANKRAVRAEEEDSSSREDEPSSERRGRRPTDLRVQNGEKYQEYSIKWNEYPEDKFDETSFSGLDVSLDDVLQERENRKSEVFRMLLEDTAFERKLRRLAEKRAKQMKREERGSDSGADGSSERTPRSSEYSSLERSSESIDEADLLRELERRIEEYFERQKQNKIKILLKKFLAEEGGRMSKLMSHSQDVLDLIALKDRELYGEFVEPKLPPAPEAAPPEFGRSVLYVDADIFEELDTEVIEIAQVEQESYIELVRDLTKRCRDELDRVRAIFRWITVKDLNRIRFPKEKINPESLLGMLKGIKDGTASYHDLFKRLCGYAGIHCHVIQGFSKGAGFRPGMKVEHKAFRNTWTAVNVSKSWRFVNCNWGARHYKNAKEIKDPKNKLCYKCDEFYFLTDPEDHIFQHFPDDKKWQLLRHPISIGEFMRLPVLKSPFFNGGLKLVRKIGDRVHTQEGQVEIVLKMRKFVGLHCTLELIENKTVVPEPEGHTLIRIIDDEVIFTVAPPDIGRYFFNVYVAENWKSNSLEHAAAFLVIAGDDCFDNGSNGVFPSTGVIGKTPVMADLGIGIPRDQDPWVHLSWQTEVTLPFSLKRDVKLSHQMRLFNREGKYVGDYDNFVFLRYKGDKSYCVRCPKEGVYALSIFAGDAKDRSPKLECILKYLINCESAMSNAPPFPKPSRKWIGCTLHEPIIGELEVNSKYKFALEIPDAVEVSVVIGDKWQSLQYSESTTDMWEGKVSTGNKPGVTASVVARYDEKSDKFSSLLDYTVIAKSSRTPHGMHRSASSSRAVEDLFR